MRKFLILAAAGSSFILIAGSNAAELISPPQGRATPATVPGAATGVSQIAPTGAPILLEAGKGTLIRLERPAATVFIANPEIADVQVKTPSLIYLSAKAPGETALYAVDPDDRVLLNTVVRVEYDLSRLRESLKQVMGGERVLVRFLEAAHGRGRADDDAVDIAEARYQNVGHPEAEVGVVLAAEGLEREDGDGAGGSDGFVAEEDEGGDRGEEDDERCDPERQRGAWADGRRADPPPQAPRSRSG